MPTAWPVRGHDLVNRNVPVAADHHRPLRCRNELAQDCQQVLVSRARAFVRHQVGRDENHLDIRRH
eukprot:8552228-Pyramimonas_sp.AAC.1